MRIANRSVSERLLAHLTTSQARLSETQERVASGKRLNRPSDDPFGASRSLTARSQRSVIEQRLRNVDLASTELSVTESALDHLTQVLARAQELATQADSSGVDGNARKQIATEVGELIKEAVTIGNTSYAGRRIFAGYQTATPPFVPDIPAAPTMVSYLGDNGQLLRDIGEGEQMAVNVRGDVLFDGVFSGLIALRDALNANDRVALDAAGAQMSVEMDTVLQTRGDVGARIRRLELTQVRLEDEDQRLREVVADVEEVDLTSEIVELQMRDTAFQAALSATGRSLQDSLLDFLR